MFVPRRHPLRSAMTLIEIMVALMIFVIAGGAMVSILVLSTDLYRRGEYSRNANDEAIAVLGELNQDLDRLISPSAGGWLYCSVSSSAGDCVLAFTAAIDTSVRLNNTGTGLEFTNKSATSSAVGNVSARHIVVWWVNGRFLYRGVMPWNPQATASAQYDVVTNFAQNPGSSFGGDTRVIAQGCLHFGTWLSFDSNGQVGFPHRQDPNTWELGTPGQSLLPPRMRYDSYDSAPNGNNLPPPCPQALRLSLTLTGGGRYAPRGTLASDNFSDHRIRVAGLGGLPMAAGTTFLRIDDEWIRYERSNGPLVEFGDEGRGARRSTKSDHGRGATVEVGQQYTLIRGISR